MKTVLLFVLLAASAFCGITCPSGSTVYTVSGGNLSAAGIANHGDGACINFSGTVVDDLAVLGTNGGTGLMGFNASGTWNLTSSYYASTSATQATVGSSTITVTSATGIYKDTPLSAVGFLVPGTTVTSVSGTTIGISSPTTAVMSSVTVILGQVIHFGSTGSDPCGSGGSSASPLATATSHGFFLAGTGSMAFTPYVPGVFIGGASTYPWYVAKTDAAGTVQITIDQTEMSNLGMANPANCSDTYNFFGGIGVADSNSGAILIDVENDWFNGFYAAVYISGSPTAETSLTAKNNLFTGRTGSVSLGNSAAGLINAVVTCGNTEYSPSAAGYMELWFGGTVSSYAPCGGTNAGYGSSLYALTGLAFNGTQPSSTVITGWLLANYASQAGGVADVISAAAAYSFTASGLYGENCNNCSGLGVYASGITTRTTGSFFASNHLSANGQGMIYGRNGMGDTGTVQADSNVILQTDAPTILGPPPCVDVYSSYTNTLSEVLFNNTCVALGGQGTTTTSSVGFFLGDSESSGSGIYMINNRISSNIVSGFYYSIWDSHYANGDTFVNSGTGGVGLYQNATYGETVPYTYSSASAPANWGTSPPHPSATYGDVDGINPSFLDPTRISLAVYDARVFGGPGTVADYFTNLGAFRSGWGSTSYAFAANPVAAAVAWFRYGFTPGNSAMCPGGVTIGAMPCVGAATAIVP